MAGPVDAVKAGLASSYKSADFSDCTITCGLYQYKVHKVVVAMHSEYFKTAFMSKFKEGESGNIELKSIDSDDADEARDDPEVVKLMVDYFYNLDHKPSENKAVGTRPDLPANAISFLEQVEAKKKKCKSKKSVSINGGVSRTHLIEHAEVFAIAVKYQIETLRKLAAEKFKDGVASHWNHVEFAEATYLVYTNTPEDVKELRDITADTIDTHADQLLKKPEIEKVVCSINGLAYEVLKRGRRNPPGTDCDQNCGTPGRAFRCRVITGFGNWGYCGRRSIRCESHMTRLPLCGHGPHHLVPEP